ncbi:MAG: hypothetical protein O3B84_03760 [Chloroflexi bacterium]|nr:hypothetical protein [Chloroflexota bacterium]
MLQTNGLEAVAAPRKVGWYAPAQSGSHAVLNSDEFPSRRVIAPQRRYRKTGQLGSVESLLEDGLMAPLLDL